MAQKNFKRKLVAIFSADVAGYSRLMGQDEASTIRMLTAYRNAMTEHIEQHQGRVVDAPGDNLLAEFDSVVDAVNCAVKTQQELAERNDELAEEDRMNFRIGVNLGDVIEEEDRIYGDGVNIAARLESLAEEGGICISGAVYDQVENKTALEFEYLGEQKVKNIAKPLLAYRVKTKTASPISKLSKALKLPDKPSIAVLPFDNLSNDPEQEHFSDGISEDIITDLSKLSGLFVIARNSSFIYKGRYSDIRQVGRELGVRYLLEGSVRKSGHRARINAQLIDTQSGHHLWAHRYDHKLEDVFAIQDEITEDIVTALDVKLVGGEQSRIWRKSLKNPEARDFYYRGLSIYHRVTKEGLTEARHLFKHVIELEPNSPLGHIWVGQTHFVEAYLGLSKNPLESLQHAENQVQKALSIDDDIVEGYAVSGLVSMFKRQYDKAISEVEKAMVLCPNGAEVFLCAAIVFLFSGKTQEAIMLSRQAIQLNPIPPPLYYNVLGVCMRGSGQYEEAIEVFKEAIARYPEYIYCRPGLVASYCSIGKYEAAQIEFQKILKLDPRFSLEQYLSRLPFKDPTDIERTLADLQKAGLL